MELPLDLREPEEKAGVVVAECSHCSSELWQGDMVIYDPVLEETYCDMFCDRDALSDRVIRRELY